MHSLFHYVAPPGPCSYLPQETASIEYEVIADLSAAEYMRRMLDGWRRFGNVLFRPRCPVCTGCRALRVDVARFHPNRSQRRAWSMNQHRVDLRVGRPSISAAKLELYDRYHKFQSDLKGWPVHAAKDAASFRETYVQNPRFTEEWCYFAAERLVGVGYVDDLPGGLSAIYFFNDPTLRQMSLGTWNVLRIIDEAARRDVPFVYLGYYVKGCGSLEYKANFRPNQIRLPDGTWQDFLS